MVTEALNTTSKDSKHIFKNSKTLSLGIRFNLPKSKAKYGSTVRSWNLTFIVEQKARIVSEYNQTRSMILTKRWAVLILQNLLCTGQILYDGSSWFSSQEIRLTKVLMKDEEQVKKPSKKLEELLRMILPSDIVLLPAHYKFLQRWYIAFGASVSLRFSEASKSWNIGWRRQPKLVRISWALFQTAAGLFATLKNFDISDEHIFRFNDVISKKNKNIWNLKRPNGRDPNDMNRQSVSKWYSIPKPRAIAPYSLKYVIITVESYRNWLIHHSFSLFCLLQENYVFRQDSALPQFLN